MITTVKYQQVNIYRMTYPERPTHCVPILVGRVPLKLARFESKETAFREAAKSLGIDPSGARFVSKWQTMKGLRIDLSSLIIPTGPGEEYIYVGHYC